MRAPVLLVEPDSSTSGFIKHMLTRAGYPVQVVPTGKEGLIAAWRDQPHIIILELELPDLDGFELISRLRSDPRTQSTKILCLTNRSEPEDTVRAIEAGVDKYLVKQKDAVEILLRELATIEAETKRDEDTTAPIQSGQMIAFLGAQGGVGTSSICINVANFLGLLDPKRRVVVLDLVLPIGSLARITGAKRGVTLASLTKLPPATLSPEYLRSNLPQPKSWNFTIVPGSDNPLQARALLEDRLSALLQTLQAAYAYIIVDIGQNLSRLALLALSQSTRMVMVLTPDEKGVTQTQGIMEFLQHERIPIDRMRFITNRPITGEGWNIEMVQEELGREISTSISNMGEDSQLANTLHAPLSLRFPDTMGTLGLQQFSTKLAADLGGIDL